MEGNFKKLLRAAMPLMIYYLLTAGAELILILLGSMEIIDVSGSGTGAISKEDLSMIVTAIISVAASVVFIHMSRQDDKRRLWEGESITEGCTALLILLGCLLCVLGNIFIGLFPLEELSESYSRVRDTINHSSLLLTFVTVTFFAPFAEELLHRVLIFGRLRDYMGTVPAALISALIFGAFHMNIVQGAYAFMIGFVLALVYARFRTLKSVFITHAAANFFSMFGGFFIQLISERAATAAAGIILSLVGTLICLHACFRAAGEKKYIYIGGKVK